MSRPKRKNVVTLLRGLPACGKTTWAEAKVKASGGNSIRVSSRAVEEMLTAGAAKRKGAQIAKTMTNQLVRSGIELGLDVILDGTHLSASNEAEYRALADEIGADFTVKEFSDVSVEECIRRDALRANSLWAGWRS